MVTLPPLGTLRVFEAAARHLSFQQAAEELHVTPSAVSHQIKALEDFLGKPLFTRAKRRVTLTPEGRKYLLPIQQALDDIRAATARFRETQDSRLLTISVAPSLASGWLVPRLSVFQMKHPDIEVRITTSTQTVDLRKALDIDIGIRFGDGQWPGLRAHRLLDMQLVPVCSPELLEQHGPIKKPSDLAGLTLLHALPRLGDWRSWFASAGARDVDPDRGPKFQDTPLAINAAVNGLGVAIADRQLVQAELDSGRLVAPFDITVPSTIGYYLVYRNNQHNDPRIKAFRDWALSEVRRDPELSSHS